METYYHPHDLGKFAEMGKGNKDLWEKFMTYYSAVFAEGALTEREKALICRPCRPMSLLHRCLHPGLS
jgi:hypothetical protein